MPYLIRSMWKKDIDEVIEIDLEAFPTMMPPTDYQREIKNEFSYYIVACDDQQYFENSDKEKRLRKNDSVIGLAGFWLMANEAHIVNIAVRQAYRHRGIGESLLIELLNLAIEKGADIITLEVRKSNTTAQKLYTKYGFNNKGIRLGYYLDDKEDAVIMTVEDVASDVFRTKLEGLKKKHYRKCNGK